jgi:hypothetical protein
MRRACALCEELGVARERDAGIVDDTLVHRRSRHRGERAVHAAVGSRFECADHVRGIRRGEASGDRRNLQRDVPNEETSAAFGHAHLAVEVDELCVDADEPRAFRKQGAIRDDHDSRRQILMSELDTQLGADARRLTRSDGYERPGVCHRSSRRTSM